MARGSSGRIVVAVDPALKRELYSALAADGSSLKDWFIKSASLYVAARRQMGAGHTVYRLGTQHPALMAAEKARPYRVKKKERKL